MVIDEKLIAYLEDLSCLTLTDAEKARIKDDLTKIFDSMAVLNGLDTTGLDERSHPFDNANDYREDTVLPSFDRELILKNAPQQSDGMFIAPKTVE